MRPFDRSCSSLLWRTFRRSLSIRLQVASGRWCALVFPMMLALLVSCGNSAMNSQPARDPAPSGFRIESTAFREGELIPTRFTCSGKDVSPALKWTEPPTGTRSFALIVDDPDAPAGVWTHWVVYNLPAEVRAMDESVPQQAELPGGGLQGLNSFGRVGYGGPCPPPGNAHRYFFRLYALDAMLSLKPGASKQAVLAATKGHVLGEAQLMGRFKR